MDLTLKKLSESFLQNLDSEKNCSQSTLTSYRTDLSQVLLFFKMKKYSTNINDISTIQVREYINYMKFEKQLHTNTIRRKIHSLSSLFTFCLQNELIVKNPMFPISAPKEEKCLPIYLNQAELERLLEAPLKYNRLENHKKRDLAMLATLAFTGVRKTELLNLDWSDIDFGTRTITVRQGKGKKDRKIPIIPPLDEYLWNYLQERLPLSNQSIFISDHGTRISSSNYHVIFKRYVRKAGLDSKISSHKIRHTFATLMYQNGVDIKTIKELLGHEDLNTTNIYTHCSVQHLKQEVQKFPLFKTNG